MFDTLSAAADSVPWSEVLVTIAVALIRALF